MVVAVLLGRSGSGEPCCSFRCPAQASYEGDNRKPHEPNHDEPESWLSRQALMLCVGSAMTEQSIVAWDLETVPDLSAARGCST